MRVHEAPNVTRNLEKAAQELEAVIGETDLDTVLAHKDLMDRARMAR